MESIREYLREITDRHAGVDKRVNRILDFCEECAKRGEMSYSVILSNKNLEELVTYLNTVAKLDTHVEGNDKGTSLLVLNW